MCNEPNNSQQRKNKRLLPEDFITQQEARLLFGPQPEPQPWSTATTNPPNAFIITLPGINGLQHTWQPPIPNTDSERQDVLDDMPALVPPTPEPFGPLVFGYSTISTVKNTNGCHSDDNIHAAFKKDNLSQETFVAGSGGEQNHK